MKSRSLKSVLLALVFIGGASAPTLAVGAAAPPEKKEGARQFLHDLLPLAWQKQPKLFFHVYTEMTEEGRRRRSPTPEQPLHYFSPVGAYQQIGWLPMAGERPPPWKELQGAMQKALVANGYKPTEDDQQRPDVLIVFTFGAHSTDVAALGDAVPPPTTAEELVPYSLQDEKAVMDVVARARFVGGPRIAEELAAALRQEMENHRMNRGRPEEFQLPVSPPPAPPKFPNGISPFNLLYGKSRETAQVLELAFRTCYFVTATAYDFAGVEKKQKVLLWQTRMTTDAQGVSMDEVLRPLIIATGEFIGRETPEAMMVTKRIDRDGRVEVGETKVVEEVKPGAADDKAGKR